MQVRLENQNNGHNKFYQMLIYSDSSTLRINYGLIGSNGRHLVKEFNTHGDAVDYYNLKLRQKLSGGYSIVDESFGDDGSSTVDSVSDSVDEIVGQSEPERRTNSVSSSSANVVKVRKYVRSY